MTITSYPSSWSLTSSSPVNQRKVSRSDSVSSLPESSNAIDKKDAKGRTVLYNAVKNGDIDETRRLLHGGADPNVPDMYRVYPIHEATERSLSDIVELLIKHGSKVNAKTVLGQTPLMRAVLYDDLEIVRILHKGGANLDERDCTGKTALLIGLQESREHVCQFLIRHGCEVNVVDRLGHSAMSCAIRASKTPNIELGRKLIRHGYDLSRDKKWMKPEEIEAVTSKKNTVIDKICNKLGIHHHKKKSPTHSPKGSPGSNS